MNKGRHQTLALVAHDDIARRRHRSEPRCHAGRGANDRIPAWSLSQSLSHDGSGVDTRLDLNRRIRTGIRSDVADARVQLERRANRSQLVIVVGGRYAEHRDDLLADRLIHDAAVPSRGVDGYLTN